jgi:D-amino peptidase
MGRRQLAASLLLLIWSFGTSAVAEARKGPKLYVSVDMEGIAGVVTGEQLGPSGFEYQRFREFTTLELLAVLDAAREAGVSDVLVSDSHGNGQNLLIERLPASVSLVRSWPRPLMMMQGIDESFDAAIFLGYHASTTSSVGVRAHTMSSARLAGVWLNGTPMPEAGINAAIAGHFGVPVIMISGDEAAVEEAQGLLGDVEGAVVKWPYSFHSARTLTPEAARQLIAAKVKKALGRLADFEPYRVETPIQLDVRFKSYRPSEILSYLSIVERTDSHSIRFMGQDVLEVSRFLEFMTTYSPSLEP